MNKRARLLGWWSKEPLKRLASGAIDWHSPRSAALLRSFVNHVDEGEVPGPNAMKLAADLARLYLQDAVPHRKPGPKGRSAKEMLRDAQALIAIHELIDSGCDKTAAVKRAAQRLGKGYSQAKLWALMRRDDIVIDIPPKD